MSTLMRTVTYDIDQLRLRATDLSGLDMTAPLPPVVGMG